MGVVFKVGVVFDVRVTLPEDCSSVRLVDDGGDTYDNEGGKGGRGEFANLQPLG